MGDDETKNLLKSCAKNLLNAVSHLENHSQEKWPSLEQESTPSVAEEHRRLFGYRPSNSSRAASSSSRNRRQLAPKRRLVTTSTGEHVTIPVRNTWTHTFMCLEKRNVTTAPSTMEKMSGSGRIWGKKHTKGGNSDHVHQKILEAFPMLADAGGYEILRTGDRERGNRELVLLSI